MPVKKKVNEKDNLYGLKEVQVRLRLAEGTTLYSAEPLSDPEGAIRVMASALREMDREFFCVVNMDTRLRPLNFNIVSVGGLNQCQIPIQNAPISARRRKLFARFINKESCQPAVRT